MDARSDDSSDDDASDSHGHYTLADILINDDALFDYIVEENKQQEVLDFCTENIDNFHSQVKEIFKIYHVILIKSSLIENEQALLSSCYSMSSALTRFSGQISSHFTRMNNILQQSTSLLSSIIMVETLEKIAIKAKVQAEEAERSVRETQKSMTWILESNQEMAKELLVTKTITMTEAANKVEKKLQLVKNIEVELEVEKEKIAEIENRGVDHPQIGEISKGQSIYTSPLFQLRLIQSNQHQIVNRLIERNTRTLESLQEQNRAMIKIIENMGIQKIQTRLQFCINIFFNIIFSRVKSKDDLLHYSGIANIFTQAWFDEGIQFENGEALSLNLHDEIDGAHEIIIRKYLACLVFSFMSGPYQDVKLENACYLRILKYQFKFDITANFTSFSLESFARHHPHEFLRLYHYLFVEDQDFTDHLSYLLSSANICVDYRCGIMFVYASIACDLLGQLNVFDEIKNGVSSFKERGKEKLLSCYERGLDEARVALDQYFHDDLDAMIELAVICFKKNDAECIARCEQIYRKIKMFTHVEVDELTNDIYEYFNYCIISPVIKNEIRQFSLFWLEFFAKNGSELAHSILEKKAETYVDCAASLARTVIMISDEQKRTRAMTILSGYSPNETNSGIAIYYYYLLKRVQKNEVDFTLLLIAAKKRVEYASNEINAIAKSDNLSLKRRMYHAMLLLLNEDAVFAFHCLKNYYRDWSVVLFNSTTPLTESDISTLILKFYTPLMMALEDCHVSAEDNFAYNILKKYALEANELAVKIIFKHAKEHWKSVMFLMDEWLPLIKTDKLQEDPAKELLDKLSKIIQERYEKSAESCYYLYLLKRLRHGTIDIDLLDLASKIGNSSAILEMDCIINNQINQKNIEWTMSEKANAIARCISRLMYMCDQITIDTYAAAEALCIYFLMNKSYALAEQYFDMTDHINVLERLKANGCLKIFLSHCEKTTLEKIPSHYQQIRGQIRTNALINFWSHVETRKNNNMAESPTLIYQPK